MGLMRYEGKKDDKNNELRHSYNTRVEYSRRPSHKPPKKENQNNKGNKTIEGQE